MVLNKLTLFILIFSIHFTYSQKVNWVSFEQAVELQKTNPKNIMMDVYTEWCGPCKMMDKNKSSYLMTQIYFSKTSFDL